MQILNQEQKQEFIQLLKNRFDKNMTRHAGCTWEMVETRIAEYPQKLVSLYEMERTGGEPDVVMYDHSTNEITFYDCSAESPKGRRSICYDRQALDARKENKPENNALDLANEIGITLLTEENYRFLQTLGRFDLKTSSWIETPLEIRKLGGALFCDCRYNQVFVYHNGAESYYAARGFRGSLIV